jgi:hypothetical protein
VEIASLQDPSAACEADAQVFLVRDLAGWGDFDVELKDRSCIGIGEAAVTVPEDLQKLRAIGADQDRHAADLDDYFVRDGAIR